MNSRTMVRLQAGGGHGALPSASASHDRKLSQAYYIRELRIWSPFRAFGLAASFIGLSLTVVSICNQYWIQGQDWQNAVIGLLVFSVAFGFLATILTICGMLTTTLPKKIYYYHSAGEIYFICALATAAALVIYPVAIEVERQMAEHTYGVGFGLGWGAAIFFLAASLCMCLDDVVRTLARICCPPDDTDRV